MLSYCEKYKITGTEKRERQRETDRQTETQRERQRQTETDRQRDTDTQTDTQTDRQAGIELKQSCKDLQRCSFFATVSSGNEKEKKKEKKKPREGCMERSCVCLHTQSVLWSSEMPISGVFTPVLTLATPHKTLHS